MRHIYNVQQTEAIEATPPTTTACNLSSDAPVTSNHIRCVVSFLDKTSHSFDIEKNATGNVLLQRVFDFLELVEKDYFGLMFIVVDSSESHRRKWIDPTKIVRKQMLCPPYHLYFRVKFYVNDPSKLRDEFTRYQLFLQIRLNLFEGWLSCNEGSLALLASYAIQSDCGDYDVMKHKDTKSCGCYKIQIAPSQPVDFGEHVAELHQLHIGQSPADAEFNFVDHARRLDMYGMDIYEGRDANGLPIEIGVGSIGLRVFHEGIKMNEYLWSSIIKLCFRKKQFIVQVIGHDPDNTHTIIVFNICNLKSCKQLWKCCIEQHTFFRLKSPPKSVVHPGVQQRRRLFFGSGFRYTGRTEYQTMEEAEMNVNRTRVFQRSFSTNHRSNGLSTSVDSSRYTNTTTDSPPSSGQLMPRTLLNDLDTDSDAFGYTSDSCLMATSSSPRQIIDSNQNHNQRDYCTDSEASVPASIRHQKAKETATNSAVANASGFYSTEAGEDKPWTPAMACTSTASIHRSATPTRRFVSPATSALRQQRASPASSLASSPPLSNKSISPPVGENQLVTIRMRPDRNGRFGFNVKGGADQNYPVIVSRVAPGSSADKCQPRLNEGDQVLFIDGRDISSMSHDHVVQFIRSARQSANGELQLTIKPNVYRLGDDIDKPDTSYAAPQPSRLADAVPRSDKLSHSLRLIGDGLKSGRIVEEFEMLYRKKPGMSMNQCRASSNVNKNRYRDVCPYDDTRVVLRTSNNGDYINANFINMEIPASGIVNRYIACQGPLMHTCADFWLMVWEQLCATIVMLTTVTERGRVKCHQYWPRLYETQEYGRLMVRCIKDRQTSNCVYREFSVRDRQTSEERRVTQMQYTAWPDHGVPDDPKHFVAFIDEVRKARDGSVDPVVVHCSAGIGRTGVLILMETAACLVESNEPVYPIEILRTMRDQRAMLIQTAGQYTFVCESILRAYNDGIVKPLAEYQKR